MSRAANSKTRARHPAVIEWPVEPGDTLGIALWNARAIAEATGGTPSGDFTVSGCAIDSREVMPGDLFFALTGETADGHRFVEGALARGAAASVVDRPVPGPHVLVPDTMAALEALGRAARARVEPNDARIIGVTGSAGKTGVKEALFAALDRGSHGRAHRSVKSFNNHVGVPLSLARMPARTRFGVFEMGMNHPGELAALTRLVRPHIAVVTTIAPAHIGHFSGEEAIAEAKAEIFEGLEPGGVAIIPADSPHYALLRARAERYAVRVIGFGASAAADVRVIDVVAAAGGGSLVTAEIDGASRVDRKLCYTVAQPGAHWVINSLAVMAAVAEAGGDCGAAGLALAEMEGLAGRGARNTVPATGGDGSGWALVIDESYNANPASMRATIAELGLTPAGRRIAVLGDMKELGDHAGRYHAGLVEPILDAGIARLVLVGPEMVALADALGKRRNDALARAIDIAHVATAAEARDLFASDGLHGGDALLVKGSNSVGLAALVRDLASGLPGAAGSIREV